MFYAIYATITVRSSDGYSSSVRQVPSFFIDDAYGGVTTLASAARVGMSVLTTMIPNGNESVEQIVVTASVYDPDDPTPTPVHTETKVLLDPVPRAPGRMTRPRLRHAR